MRPLLLAILLATGVGGVSIGSTTPATPAPTIRHACTINHCGHCPKGKWYCNGQCIPKNHACRLIP